jgi:hypothetical protein
MWANTTIHAIIKILIIPLNILSLVTTLVSGIIAAIPLVNLAYILLITLIWQMFLWPLLALAWAWEKLPKLIQPVLALPGIPLAVLGNVFVSLHGAMSADPEDRVGHFTKQGLCQQWPYVFVHVDDGRSVIRAIQEDEGLGFASAVFRYVDMVTRRQLGLA